MPPVVEPRRPVVTAPLVAESQHRLSPENILESRKPFEAMIEKNTAHLYSLQTQLGAYLVLGNGIALFTLSQAIMQNAVARSAWTEAVYLRFTWGLAIAFTAMAFTYLFGLFGNYVLGMLSQYYLHIADADQKIATTADSSAKHAALRALHSNSEALSKHQKQLPVMVIGMAAIIAVYILSGGLFVWGLLGALHLAP